MPRSNPGCGVNPRDGSNLIGGVPARIGFWQTAFTGPDDGVSQTAVERGPDLCAFTRCGVATPSNNGNYERASDPWVTYLARWRGASDLTVVSTSSIRTSDPVSDRQTVVTVELADRLHADTDDGWRRQREQSPPIRETAACVRVGNKLFIRTRPRVSSCASNLLCADDQRGRAGSREVIYDPGVDAQDISNRSSCCPNGDCNLLARFLHDNEAARVDDSAWSWFVRPTKG